MIDLFLKLANMSFAAGWIVIAVLVLRLFLKKTPKWISCLLWGIVALRLVMPFVFESPFSLLPSAEAIPQDIISSQSPVIQSGIPVLNHAVKPIVTTHVPQGGSMLAQPLQLFAVIWLAGMILMLLYGVFTYCRLRWQVRVSIPVQKNLYICDDIQSPFVFGFFRPRIYIPSGLRQTQLQHVLAHENAHIKRHDHWWKPLGFMLLSVYWFNPLLWVAYILLCRDIEQACDESVIADMDLAEKKGYSETLLACSMHRRMVMVCPVAFGEVGIKTRIMGVLSYKKPGLWIILASVSVCVVTAVCFLTNPQPCEHSYQQAITMEPTCTGKGVRTYTCQLCEGYYTEPVQMLPHNYDAGSITVAPSCTKMGTKRFTCMDCGATKTESVEKTPHIAGEPIFITEANCTQTGEKTATCTACRTRFVAEILEINDVHCLQETVVRAATCTAAGEGVYNCTRCSYSEPCTYAQLEHNFEKQHTFQSTCASEGGINWVCTDCDAEKWTSLPIDPDNHQWMSMVYGTGFRTQCIKCGKKQDGGSSNSNSSGYSLIDDLYLDPPKTQKPEDLFPEIIWDVGDPSLRDLPGMP